MASEKLPNRWGIAVAAVIMQICFGAAYGWSVFKKPLMGGQHWTETSVQLNFTLAIFFLGVGTIIGGLWQDRVGPRKVASVAGILYGIGYIVSGISASSHSRGAHRGSNPRISRPLPYRQPNAATPISPEPARVENFLC